jgi:hypothetical protein
MAMNDVHVFDFYIPIPIPLILLALLGAAFGVWKLAKIIWAAFSNWWPTTLPRTGFHHGLLEV